MRHLENGRRGRSRDYCHIAAVLGTAPISRLSVTMLFQDEKDSIMTRLFFDEGGVAYRLSPDGRPRYLIAKGADGVMRAANTNNVQNPNHKREFKRWMTSQPDQWPLDLDSPTRTHLFWCLDFANEIERCRDTLAQNKRARLSHPMAMKRAYEPEHCDVATKVEATLKPKDVAHIEEVEKLQRDIALRDREIEFLKSVSPARGQGPCRPPLR
jgi:hypothetical protein